MSDEHTAYGNSGQKLPLSPDEVRETARRMLWKGDLILVISAFDGDVAVNVMGPPARATLELLEVAVESYRKIVEEHGL